MTKYKDLTGMKFGRLTVMRLDRERTKRKTYWFCECECGNIKSVRSDSLQCGAILSCGCLKKEQDRVNLTKNHSHKMSGTRLYETWCGMKRRCNNPNDKRYDRYGGRGISVCEEWESSFETFMKWAYSNGYKDNLLIDRINNDGNYEPSNCRWTDNKTQCNNRRSNIPIIINGETMTLKEYAERTGLSATMLYARYNRGERGDRLTREPFCDKKVQRGTLNANNVITKEQAKLIKARLSKGETAIQISRSLNISKHIVYDIKRGKTWAWI